MARLPLPIRWLLSAGPTAGLVVLSSQIASASQLEPGGEPADLPAAAPPATMNASSPSSSDQPASAGSETVTGPAVGGTTVPSRTGPEAAPEPGGANVAAGAKAQGSAGNATPSLDGSGDEIDPNLLAGTEEEPTPPPSDLGTSVQDDGAREAALARQYDQRYRPADNPGRFNLSAHVLFANAGGDGDVGGRMGGAQIDAGQSWNNFGYALTVSTWAGRVYLPGYTEMNAMFGLGPSISLGRRSLVGRGFLDFRVGYDILYGVVNRRNNAPTTVTVGSDTGPVLEQTDNLLPHGPRARLDMGLMLAGNRKWLQGVGLSAGYQGLVGSARGEIPFTHMLTLGFAYWLG